MEILQQHGFQLKACVGVLLASLPSIPVFLMLQLGNKFSNIKQNTLFQASLSLCLGMLLVYVLLPVLSFKHSECFSILLGVISFWVIDILTMIMLDRCAENKQKQQKAILYLFGDLIHNFTDGIAIGASFLIDDSLGLVTVMGTALHELPHEVSDFAYLMQCGYSIKTVLKTQLLTASGALLGAQIGLFMGDAHKNDLIGFTIGVFLQNCLYTLLPEITDMIKQEEKTSRKIYKFIVNIISMLVGISLVQNH